MARRVLRDAGMADDVVQETLLRALRPEATVDLERAGAWLTVVGRRLAVDASRARGRVDVVAECDDRPSVGEDPADLAERRQLLAQLAEAMDELSPRQRRLLLRQVGTGLSLAQLAEEERTTVASVRSVLARAREALRSKLHHSGWLVAGLLPRLLAAARSPAERLITRIERAVPILPQARHDLAEVFTAGAAAVALLLSAFAGSSSSGGGDTTSEAVGASAAADTVAPPLETSSALYQQLSEVDVGMPALSVEDDLSGLVWWHMPPEREHVVIPFQDFGGDIRHFAVAPDQKTVFATGGWTETERSRNRETLTREWTPVFYRSDNGGGRWARHEVPGFLPGRVLFAPGWPLDPRVFVVTDDASVLRSEDGGRTFDLVQQVGSVRPDAGRPEQVLDLGHYPFLPDPDEDPSTTVRRQQHAPVTPEVRPAVLSPKFPQGDEVIYIGGEDAGVFDVRLGVLKPLASVPPWQATYGVAPAPDHAETGAVLVGAVAHGLRAEERGAVFRCHNGHCEELRRFDDMGNPPGVFVSPTDPKLVYAWTPYVAYRSDDAGMTWTRQVLGPVLDLVEIGRRLLFVSMSGVPVSDDRGVTWRELHMVYSMSAAASIGQRHLVVSAGPGVACSPDAGDVWLASCPAL